MIMVMCVIGALHSNLAITPTYAHLYLQTETIALERLG